MVVVEPIMPTKPCQTALFQQQGFLVLEDFLSSEECAQIKQRSQIFQNCLLKKVQPSLPPFYVFSTSSQAPMHYYYFSQARRALFYFVAENKLSKISASLHDLDPFFNSFSRQSKIKSLIAQLGVRLPLLVQSMYLFKPPHINETVACHQDSSFLDTTPSSMITLWFALEDATLHNGCLWVYPNDHRSPLRHRLTLKSKRLEMVLLDPRPWTEEGKKVLEVNAGTVVVLDGHLPHSSGPNFSENTRQAFTLHIIDGRYLFGSENWLQPSSEDSFKGF